MVTHGHMYGVSLSTCQLEEEARSRQVQVVMFGHTHYPYLDEEEDLTVLNPGSLSYPRQPGRKPSYLVMQIDEQGKAHYEHRYLEKSWKNKEKSGKSKKIEKNSKKGVDF